MTLAKDEGLGRIEEAISAEQLADQPGILISYILLTEWATADGYTYMVESRPEDQTYWRTLGLLEAGRMSVDHSVQQNQNESGTDDS